LPRKRGVSVWSKTGGFLLCEALIAVTAGLTVFAAAFLTFGTALQCMKRAETVRAAVTAGRTALEESRAGLPVSEIAGLNKRYNLSVRTTLRPAGPYNKRAVSVTDGYGKTYEFSVLEKK